MENKSNYFFLRFLYFSPNVYKTSLNPLFYAIWCNVWHNFSTWC